MLIFLTLSFLFLLLAGFIYIKKILNKKQFTLVQNLSGFVFFALFFYRLFQNDAIDSIYALNGFLGPLPLAVITLIRWMTAVSILLTLSSFFVKIRTINNLKAFFVPLTAILNIIFFNLNITAFTGLQTFALDLRAYIFAAEIALMGALGGYSLYEKIKPADFCGFKKI